MRKLNTEYDKKHIIDSVLSKRGTLWIYYKKNAPTETSWSARIYNRLCNTLAAINLKYTIAKFIYCQLFRSLNHYWTDKIKKKINLKITKIKMQSLLHAPYLQNKNYHWEYNITRSIYVHILEQDRLFSM